MSNGKIRIAQLGYTLLAIPTAFAVWLAIYLAGYMALTLLDIMRGLGDDWLQTMFKELFTPAIGGYFAFVITAKWLIRANMNVVFWLFSIPIFLFLVALPITVMLFFMPEGWTFSWRDQITRWLIGVSSIAGAAIAHRKI